MTIALIRGDCLEVMPTLEAGSVDAVITDPPYGISYQSCRRTDKDSRFPIIAGDRHPCVDWMPASWRTVRDSGCMLDFCRWDTAEYVRQAIVDSEWTLRSQGVWDRVIHGMGDLDAQLAPTHDLMWFCTKGAYVFPGKRPKSVYHSKRISGQKLLHPTQKPVGLMWALVADLVPPGGTVLDPFMGSGSTGVACVKTGRSFIGIEIDPGYFEIATNRIKEAQMQPRLGL